MFKIPLDHDAKIALEDSGRGGRLWYRSRAGGTGGQYRLYDLLVGALWHEANGIRELQRILDFVDREESFGSILWPNE